MLSKIYGEALCQFSDLPFTIFRPHNIYGPRMGMSHVIPQQLEKAYYAHDGSNLDVPSTEQTRCFCYIDDAVEMLKRMMCSEKCLGETLNLGQQQPEAKIRDVVEICWSNFEKDLRLVSVAPTPVRLAPLTAGRVAGNLASGTVPLVSSVALRAVNPEPLPAKLCPD